MRCRAGSGYSSSMRVFPTGGVAIHAPSLGKTRPRTSFRSRSRASASTSGGMTSSPSPMAMASTASWWNQSGSREASWPPTTTKARGFSRLMRCARRMVRFRSVVKLHCRPTTSASKARQSARPCSSPSMRMSMTLHSWPPASRHAATQIGPRGSTKVSISRPRMPPIGGFRNAIFMGALQSVRSRSGAFYTTSRHPSRTPLGDLSPAALFEQGPQPCQLGFRGVRSLALRLSKLQSRLGPLALRLGLLFLGRHQSAVRTVQPHPISLLIFPETVPEAEEKPELSAPKPTLVPWCHRLGGAASQPEALHPPGVRLVHVVLRGPEDAGVELLLHRAVDMGGGRGQQLDDDV